MEIINENELLQRLRVGRPTLWKMRQEGCPYIQIGKQGIRYDYADVVGWLKERTKQQRRERNGNGHK